MTLRELDDRLSASIRLPDHGERSAAVTGSGLNHTALTALKMALLDPMANAKVRMVATVKPRA